MEKLILARGKFLNLVQRGRWEFAEREQASGVVVIVPRLADGRWMLIEQYREPVAGRCIEFPAGLAGDSPEDAGEELASAAARELEEETGYRADKLDWLGRAAPTPGLTSEVMTFFAAVGLTQVTEGGGVGEEQIITHLIADEEIDRWLVVQSQTATISAMVYGGLYLMRRNA